MTSTTVGGLNRFVAAATPLSTASPRIVRRRNDVVRYVIDTLQPIRARRWHRGRGHQKRRHFSFPKVPQCSANIMAPNQHSAET